MRRWVTWITLVCFVTMQTAAVAGPFEEGTAAGQAATANAASARALQSLHGRLVTAGGAYPQPMLIDQLANVALMISQADQKVGRDAFARFEDLSKELAAVEAEAARLGIR